MNERDELSPAASAVVGAVGIAALGFSLFAGVVVPLAAYKYLRS